MTSRSCCRQHQSNTYQEHGDEDRDEGSEPEPWVLHVGIHVDAAQSVSKHGQQHEDDGGARIVSHAERNVLPAAKGAQHDNQDDEEGPQSHQHPLDDENERAQVWPTTRVSHTHVGTCAAQTLPRLIRRNSSVLMHDRPHMVASA